MEPLLPAISHVHLLVTAEGQASGIGDVIANVKSDRQRREGAALGYLLGAHLLAIQKHLLLGHDGKSKKLSRSR